MADTTNYGWTKPVVFGSDDTWGTILNTAFDDIDADLKSVANAIVPATMLTSLLAVDGDGSGLDADKLDGVDGSKYLKHAGAYASGSVTVSTSAPSGGADGDIWLKV